MAGVIPAPALNTAIASGAAFGNSGGQGAGGGVPGEDIQIGQDSFWGGVAKSQGLFASCSSYDGLQIQMLALANTSVFKMFGDGNGGLLDKFLLKGLDMDKFGAWDSSGGSDGGGGGEAPMSGDDGGFSQSISMAGASGGQDVNPAALGSLTPSATPGAGQVSLGVDMGGGGSSGMGMG